MQESLIQELQQIVDAKIVPAEAMKFRIGEYDGESIFVSAPLEKNLNHHGTAFGGSQYAIAAVAGWALLRCKLAEYALSGSIVVKSATMEYQRPVSEDFRITVRLAKPDALAASMDFLKSNGKANFDILGEIQQSGKTAALYSGQYAIR